MTSELSWQLIARVKLPTTHRVPRVAAILKEDEVYTLRRRDHIAVLLGLLVFIVSQCACDMPRRTFDLTLDDFPWVTESRWAEEETWEVHLSPNRHYQATLTLLENSGSPRGTRTDLLVRGYANCSECVTSLRSDLTETGMTIDFVAPADGKVTLFVYWLGDPGRVQLSLVETPE